MVSGFRKWRAYLEQVAGSRCNLSGARFQQISLGSGSSREKVILMVGSDARDMSRVLLMLLLVVLLLLLSLLVESILVELLWNLAMDKVLLQC